MYASINPKCVLKNATIWASKYLLIHEFPVTLARVLDRLFSRYGFWFVHHSSYLGLLIIKLASVTIPAGKSPLLIFATSTNANKVQVYASL
jgi:hypothetical protein